jgi:Ni,Fe-hydrogenase maturation factor
LKTGIIDYEFSIEGFIDQNRSFQYGDFLISSLLFTHGDEEKLYQMLKKLVELGVSGLAIKNVFFPTIPEKAIRFCDENAFPLVLFDNAIYFEDIVNDIDHLLQLSDWVNKVEQQIGIILGTELSRYEVEGISRDMGLSKLPYLMTYWLKPKMVISQTRMKQIVQSFSKNRYRKESCFLLKYKQNYLVVLNANDNDEKKFKHGFNDVLELAGLGLDEYVVGVSSVHCSASELDFSIKESAWSCQVANLLNENIKRYNELGIWSIISAHYQSKYMIDYMKKYLQPLLLDASESSKDLLGTLIAFVSNQGNTKLIAKKLNIHENTFRYRMNKLKEKLDPNANEYVFFENASAAIKIYLLDLFDKSMK